jgi:Rieske Fe-S protein
MTEEKGQSRRKFLDSLLAGGAIAWLGSVFYPILAYLRPPEESSTAVSSVRVGALRDFPPDSGTIFRFGRKPGILICTPDGDLRAFEATCTHLDCTVQYRKDLGIIWCACHNGQYDLRGKNIAGPPPRPLEELRVDRKGEEVFVSRAS